ncbi:MAG TPA: argininosuccinate lyase [Chitinophagaceae bacterium]|nr:argininosuccinate lyase [Chitinophagaceae bacterium]
MKLWEKDSIPLQEVDRFTVGKDREMDIHLAAFDVLGSIAHAQMLESVGLLSKPDRVALEKELRSIFNQVKKGEFRLADDAEDIHSQVEQLLTQKLGDTGKKIHSARSRNDQVLVDIRLFLRDELEEIVKAVVELFALLQQQSEKYKDQLLPGYTHLQLAMPSSFGLWFGSYAESITDDTITIKAAFDIVNQNPLGSAAGYGSSFPIDREMTTRLLGFASLSYNSVYAQMGRGKTERIVAMALANLADTLARLATDACLFMNENFGFISFPEELTTGSSIMPHKKNPDVFELIRAHCNRLRSLPNTILMMTANLPSGYHRDLQLLKEELFPAFRVLKDCMEMTGLMLSKIKIRSNILEDDKYKYLFSVEEVNRLVSGGIPFRDAYKKVGQDIASGNFNPTQSIHHTHAGSIGNLCSGEIKAKMQTIINSFPFSAIRSALQKLVE